MLQSSPETAVLKKSNSENTKKTESNMRLQIKLGTAILATVLLGAGAAPVAAQKSADTLRITDRNALPNVDPYYNNLRTGVVMHHQAWDGLVYRDPETFKVVPLLATEWKLPDTTTIFSVCV
jgi:peptide/nickel transport system substrate-binding protein